MSKTCNGCVDGELMFKVSGAILIYDKKKLVKCLPNKDLSDQHYCGKCAKNISYLKEVLEDAETQGEINLEEIRMIEKGLENLKKPMKFTLTASCWKVQVNSKMVAYYQCNIYADTKFTEKSLNSEVEVNSLEDLKKIVEDNKKQWKENEERELIIDFDNKTIEIYNSYRE